MSTPPPLQALLVSNMEDALTLGLLEVQPDEVAVWRAETKQIWFGLPT
jgi:hypothetical protein